MKIVADSNILFAEELFKDFGELVLYKNIISDKNILKNADALLCRSTMRVGAELLNGTKVCFVATATSGTEHIDKLYLDKSNIKFADARGSNSNSVAEYVISSILNIAIKNNLSLSGKTLGIIGWGNIGKKVEIKAKAIGLKVFVNDPPLEDIGENKNFSSIEEILKCDIITIHTPLIKNGKYKTENLFDSSKIFQLKKGTIFINSARGKIVDETELINAKRKGIISHAIIDVWNNEPEINFRLFEHIDIATPHIAGHSYDGKALGSFMIFKDFCDFFKLEPTINKNDILKEEQNVLQILYTGNIEQDIYSAISHIYNVEVDDANLRKMSSIDDKISYFNSLRNNYWKRREFSNTKVNCDDKKLTHCLSELGFKTNAN
jgi:erythronate-4-phosphate dehydrogenase